MHSYLTWQAQLPADSKAWIRYEDLLADLDGTLDLIGKELALRPSDSGFRDIGERVDSNRQRTGSSFDSTFYLDREYLDEFTDEDFDAILAALDAWGLPPATASLPFTIEHPRDPR